jgi:hypothetical protein
MILFVYVVQKLLEGVSIVRTSHAHKPLLLDVKLNNVKKKSQYLSLHPLFKIRLIALVVTKEIAGNHHLLDADFFLPRIDASHHSIRWAIAYSSFRYLAVHVEWAQVPLPCHRPLKSGHPS